MIHKNKNIFPYYSVLEAHTHTNTLLRKILLCNIQRQIDEKLKVTFF